MSASIHKAPCRHPPYRASRTEDPMKRLLLLVLTAATLLVSTGVSAHHDGEHGNPGDTTQQSSGK